jgi:hypothetical protein
MLGMDTQGTATVAAALRLAVIMRALTEGGTVATPTTQEATSQYVSIAGAGDPGASLVQVLDWWCKKGLKAGGGVSKIDGYVTLAPGDQRAMQQAVSSRWGVAIGMNITRQWYEDAAPGFVWDVTDSPFAAPITVAVVGYDPAGIDVAWAGLTGTLTWGAYAAAGVVDEVVVVFPQGWQDVEGFRSAELRAALDAVRSGSAPVVPVQQTAAPQPAAATAAPPPPAPPEGQSFTGTASMTVMGQTVQVPVTGTVTGTTPATTGRPWLAILREMLGGLQDATDHQWAGVAMRFATVLQLLECLPSAEEQEQFLSDLGEAIAATRDSDGTESA